MNQKFNELSKEEKLAILEQWSELQDAKDKNFRERYIMNKEYDLPI